jgi:hypothetical protein
MHTTESVSQYSALCCSLSISVDVDSRHSRDEGTDNLIRVLKTRKIFLGEKPPRGPENVSLADIMFASGEKAV